jgi:predicted HD phosphohydrolase
MQTLEKYNLYFPRTVNDLLSVFRQSSPEHGLQCAYELLQQRPTDVELQVAGLFHDVAHRVIGADEASHGIVGEQILRPLFGSRVASLVRLHVPAKRYLVTTRPEYAAILAGDSQHTLALQGGNMTQDEIAEFLFEEQSNDAVAVRIADDRAKVHGRSVPTLAYWEPIVRRLHTAHTSAPSN